MDVHYQHYQHYQQYIKYKILFKVDDDGISVMVKPTGGVVKDYAPVRNTSGNVALFMFRNDVFINEYQFATSTRVTDTKTFTNQPPCYDLFYNYETGVIKRHDQSFDSFQKKAWYTDHWYLISSEPRNQTEIQYHLDLFYQIMVWNHVAIEPVPPVVRKIVRRFDPPRRTSCTCTVS